MRCGNKSGLLLSIHRLEQFGGKGKRVHANNGHPLPKSYREIREQLNGERSKESPTVVNWLTGLPWSYGEVGWGEWTTLQGLQQDLIEGVERPTMTDGNMSYRTQASHWGDSILPSLYEGLILGPVGKCGGRNCSGNAVPRSHSESISNFTIPRAQCPYMLATHAITISHTAFSLQFSSEIRCSSWMLSFQAG